MKKMRSRPKRKENREKFYDNKFASNTIYPLRSFTGQRRLFQDEGVAEIESVRRKGTNEKLQQFMC